ncbi:hypothetical protein GQ43DRAFT_491301 [Delitschia confertaspora ATCC 74209]|uniref:Uncharacterized protein n=1 Tax=Delitschia confertaspora ATCC 74209 TaxID=1513339 RepID=A0A9P4JHN2_9PLEO|nr:hypothetical protein GQ43DRAFT_491301 [Delitschia confertaspora ATCC 74209]
MAGGPSKKIREPGFVQRQRPSRKLFGLEGGERWSGSKLLIDFLDELFNDKPAITKSDRPAGPYLNLKKVIEERCRITGKTPAIRALEPTSITSQSTSAGEMQGVTSGVPNSAPDAILENAANDSREDVLGRAVDAPPSSALQEEVNGLQIALLETRMETGNLRCDLDTLETWTQQILDWVQQFVVPDGLESGEMDSARHAETRSNSESRHHRFSPSSSPSL